VLVTREGKCGCERMINVIRRIPRSLIKSDAQKIGLAYGRPESGRSGLARRNFRSAAKHHEQKINHPHAGAKEKSWVNDKQQTSRGDTKAFVDGGSRLGKEVRCRTSRDKIAIPTMVV